MFLSEKNPLSNWQSRWNRSLVSFYIFLYFLEGVTRFKNALTLLMVITALVYCYQLRAKALVLSKTTLASPFSSLSLAWFIQY